MFCAISGVTPEEPVVSKKSGHVYEKRLITQQLLASGGKDPITGDDMTEDDLIEVKVSGQIVTPIPTTSASIPGTLTQLRNEWDAMMLESFKLKQSLRSTRVELSHSLYHYDAALRVIARLTNERDEARKALAELRSQGVAIPEEQEKMNGSIKKEEDQMDVDTDMAKVEGLSEDTLGKISAKADDLKTWRMKRPAVEGLLKAAELSTFKPLDELMISKKKTAVNFVRPAVRRTTDGDRFVILGCADGKCRIVDEEAKKVVNEFAPQKEPITGMTTSAAGDIVITTGRDSEACIWRSADEKYKESSLVFSKQKTLTSCSMHATETYFATTSLDGSWALHDIETAKTLAQVADTEPSPSNCGEFHPDGAIFTCGLESGIVRIWDVRSLTTAASFETNAEGDSRSVSSIALSENGYYLVSVSGSRTIQLWDLRKLKATKMSKYEGLGLNAASFDLSGGFLSVAGSSCVKVFDVKKWKELASFEGEEFTSAGFNRTSSRLYCGSMRGVVLTYGKN